MSIDTLKVMNQKIDTGRHENLMYKGRDGRDYSTPEALRRADETWARTHLTFKGDDGREYQTFEALMAANRAHFQSTHFYIVHDAELGRREIAPGTGEVQVCVGYFIERDPTTGKTKYVPAYRTETF